MRTVGPRDRGTERPPTSTALACASGACLVIAVAVVVDVGIGGRIDDDYDIDSDYEDDHEDVNPLSGGLRITPLWRPSRGRVLLSACERDLTRSPGLVRELRSFTHFAVNERSCGLRTLSNTLLICWQGAPLP